MKIYQIELKTNEYHSLVPDDPGVWKTELLTMKCQPKEDRWISPRVRIDNPMLKRADFLRLTSGAFVITEAASNVVRSQLDIAGELLPIHWDSESGYLLNILECSNCLDHDNTEWYVHTKTGKQISTKKLAFLPHLVPESTLFKIPEKLATIYAVEGIKDPEDEFKYLVETTGLEGLRFKLVWEENQCQEKQS